MTKDTEELLECSFKLRKVLGQVLPPDAVDYIMNPIAKDGAHQRYLDIVKENENDSSV